MSVGLKIPDLILPVQGIRLSAISAGIYHEQRQDLALIEIAPDSNVSAVFTKNLFCAAPVVIAKKHLESSEPRYCLINAGNANAGTGQPGIEAANRSCSSLANLVDCDLTEVLPFSTGVIGEKLPVEKIEKALPDLLNDLSQENWLLAAKSIMTTDTVPKLVSECFSIDGQEITITGISKGAGMIKPNMATMLAYVATNACIEKACLDVLLKVAVDKSFNRITVDGDTSTNDACVLIATGKANNALINGTCDTNYKEFENKLITVFCKLAQAIIRDGEGASKYIEIEVNEGNTIEDCLAVAYAVGESPLVKTAFTASDPNWGRILAALGRSGAKSIDIDKVSIYLDELCIVNCGQRDSDYTETAGQKVMSQEEIKITINLGTGTISEKIWTTDLSHDYVTINSEYRT